MPDPVTTLTLLGALGNVSAIISATADVLGMRKADPNKPIAKEDKERILEPFLAKPPPPTAPAQIDEIIISPAILQSAIKNIENNVILYADTLNDPRTTYLQVDEQKQLLTARICSTLKLIRDHNAGKFPDKKVENYWKEFRCT
jgi:hypothetical protein